MSKALLRVGYTTYVMDISKAVMVAEAFASSEVYDTKYSKDIGGNSVVTKHVYPQDEDSNITIEVLMDNVYRMYKLAGKPEKE